MLYLHQKKNSKDITIMKRYNLSQIMKDSHRLYNNEYQRKGRSWGECLQAAWRWDKVRAEKEAKLQAMIEASWAAHNDRKNQPANRITLLGMIATIARAIWAHSIVAIK